MSSFRVLTACAHVSQIYTINSIEDFWAVYNNVPEAGIIPAGSTYHFFKVRETKSPCDLI